MKFIIFLLVAMIMTGCKDKAMVHIYRKSIVNEPIKCLKLSVLPRNHIIENTLHKLYHFEDSCPVRLDVSYKSGIVCNSNQNVQTRTISGFPSSYLKMEIRKAFSLQYSYYIDLDENVTADDVENAFERISEDLHIHN